MQSRRQTVAQDGIDDIEHLVVRMSHPRLVIPDDDSRLRIKLYLYASLAPLFWLYRHQRRGRRRGRNLSERPLDQGYRFRRIEVAYQRDR